MSKRRRCGSASAADASASDFNTFAELLEGTGRAPRRKPAAPGTGAAPVAGTHRVTIERTVGGGTTAAAAAAAAWKPVTFARRPNWSQATCFGCEYGYPGETAPANAHPALRGFWKLLADNYGKEMGDDELARVLHVFFTENIQAPMAREGIHVSFPPAMILEHLHVHMLEPTVNCGTAIRNLRCVERWLRDQVRVKNAQGEYRVDLKSLKALLDTQRQIQMLYNAKPSRQLFYSDALKLDRRREHQRD